MESADVLAMRGGRLVLRGGHVQLIAIGDEPAAGNHFDLALPIDGNLVGGDPLADAWRLDREGARSGGHTPEVVDDLLRGHTDIVGNPNSVSIGNPAACQTTIVGTATVIGDRLKSAREELQARRGEKKPNRAKFARELGITAASLSDLESGESGRPSSETLLKLRDRGINPDYIMRGKGPKFVDHVERHLNKQTLLGMMDELDEDEQKILIETAAAFIRRHPGSSPNEPFKEPPPKGD